MTKYSVVSSCDHIECTYNQITVVLDVISAEAAFVVANDLNRRSADHCPICGNQLGYFPVEDLEK